MPFDTGDHRGGVAWSIRHPRQNHAADCPSDHLLAQSDSNVTPPVCLLAFTAAGHLQARSRWQQPFESWKIAKGLYIVPLMFAYTPLITGNAPPEILQIAFCALHFYGTNAADPALCGRTPFNAVGGPPGNRPPQYEIKIPPAAAVLTGRSTGRKNIIGRVFDRLAINCSARKPLRGQDQINS